MDARLVRSVTWAFEGPTPGDGGGGALAALPRLLLLFLDLLLLLGSVAGVLGRRGGSLKVMRGWRAGLYVWSWIV